MGILSLLEIIFASLDPTLSLAEAKRVSKHIFSLAIFKIIKLATNV
jgi:hypothetical protein